MQVCYTLRKYSVCLQSIVKQIILIFFDHSQLTQYIMNAEVTVEVHNAKEQMLKERHQRTNNNGLWVKRNNHFVYKITT